MKHASLPRINPFTTRGGHQPVLLMVLLLVLLAPLVVRSQETPSTSAPSAQLTELTVVRIRATTPAQTRRLSGMGLDLLEMRDGADLFALVTPPQQAALLADGWDVRPDAEQTDLLRRAASLQTFQNGYRSAEEIEQFLRKMAADYPTLAALVDFGDSWERQQYGAEEGHDLLALRLSSQETAGPKPVFFLMAGIHAREITTPEVAMRFIAHLLSGYGVDADATWLLNEYEVVVAPLINPDGYRLAGQGYMQRKNMNTSYGGDCPVPPFSGYQFGVDLNRNFDYQWGTVDSPDIDPCNATFPGDAPTSEPETQAVQAFVRSLFPDHTPPDDTTTSPNTTSGVLITMHSYSNLVLWPWGHIGTPAPDADALRRLGERMADFNGYFPTQAVGLYYTSGTTDDWSYGELGIASYTFEIGPTSGTCGGFMPPFACLDGEPGGNFWPRNLPALLYAARVSRAPYIEPAGPPLAVERASVVSDTARLTLTLTLDKTRETPTELQAFIGASQQRGSQSVTLHALSAAGQDNQRWRVNLPRSQFEAACDNDDSTCLQQADEQSLPVVLVRGRGAADVWGPLYAVWPQPGTEEETAEPPLRRVWLPLVTVE